MLEIDSVLGFYRDLEILNTTTNLDRNYLIQLGCLSLKLFTVIDWIVLENGSFSLEAFFRSLKVGRRSSLLRGYPTFIRTFYYSCPRHSLVGGRTAISTTIVLLREIFSNTDVPIPVFTCYKCEPFCRERKTHDTRSFPCIRFLYGKGDGQMWQMSATVALAYHPATWGSVLPWWQIYNSAYFTQ